MIILSQCFHLPKPKTAVTCKTAENEDGKCLEITECKSLADFLEKPMNKAKIVFLKQSTCGFQNELPKICCPEIKIQVKTVDTQVDESTTTETITTEVVTDVEMTTIKVSDEFDFSLRDGETYKIIF